MVAGELGERSVGSRRARWTQATARSQEAAAMETYVLIPAEFSLAVRAQGDPKKSSRKRRAAAADVGVWANALVERGSRIFSFQGTVRMDRLEAAPYADPTDIRYRYGMYEEMVTQGNGEKVHYCNWIRFLRYSSRFTSEVNVVASKVNGEPVFEVIRVIPAETEVVALFLPERFDEEFFLPAMYFLRRSLYKKTMGTLIETTPLDLSKSLLYRKYCPPSPSSDSSDELKSSSGESLSSDLDALSSRVHAHRFKEKHLLPCDVCQKAFDRPSLLKRHMRTHTGEKPHVCEVCGKGFSTSSSLNTHRRIHSGEKPHQCGVCGKRFTASSNLYYHRMTHVKDKPHKCHLCSKSFPTPGDLKSHMYVHNGSWPYKCHICGRGFSKHTNLKNHLFLHTGNKPHVCKICSKRFALACNLRAHIRTHEDARQKLCHSPVLPVGSLEEEYRKMSLLKDVNYVL